MASYIRVRELICQCLGLFNEELLPYFRLTENAEFYQLFMAKKKTGTPKEDYPALDMNTRVASTKMDTFSLVCSSPALFRCQETLQQSKCCCVIF